MFLDVDECILQHLLEKGHLLRAVHLGRTCKALHTRARDYLKLRGARARGPHAN